MASSFFSRTRGLMGRHGIGAGRALVLKPCNSIHTCFMRFPIDAVFVAKNGTVQAIVYGLKPWRLTPIFWKAHYCIEFESGYLPTSAVSIGDQIILKQ